MMSKKSHVIYVEPVKTQSVQGRHKREFGVFDPVTGEQVGSHPLNQARGSRVSDRYSFSTDFNRRRVVAGLDEFVENPFYKLAVEDVKNEYALSVLWADILPNIVEKEKITKQREFEIRAGVDPDFYTSELRGATILDADKGTGLNAAPPTELQKFKFILYPRTNRIDDSTPRGRLAIQMLRNNGRIAASIEDVNPGIHRFYISEENEAQDRKVKRQEVITAGMYSYETLKRKHTEYDRYKAAVLLKDVKGNTILKGNDVPDERVKEVILDFIASSNRHQTANCLALSHLTEKFEKAEGQLDSELDYLIQQAINSNAINTRDGIITWTSQVKNENVKDFTSLLAFKNFIRKEQDSYTAKSKTQNWYKELVDEVKQKGIWIK